LALLVSTPARADSGTTLNAAVAPVIRAGSLEGCAINFDAVRQDTEYNRGELVYVSGSLNFLAIPGKVPWFSLKLGIKPLSGGAQAEYQKPADAYLLNGFTTNAAERITAFDGETPGFRIFGFKVGDEGMKAIEKVGETGKLHVGYAMRVGGMVAPLTIDLRMKRLDLDNPSKSETAVSAPLEWFDCMKAAAERSLEANAK
jgi:hypothetical protein